MTTNNNINLNIYPNIKINKTNYKTLKTKNYGFIYVLIEREFINNGQNIYKIGRTNQINLRRFRNYPKGSKLLFYMKCFNRNSISIENDIMNDLKKSEYIKQKNDIGKEYFEGNLKKIIEICYNNIIQ